MIAPFDGLGVAPTTVNFHGLRFGMLALNTSIVQMVGRIRSVYDLSHLESMKWCREGESNPQDPKVGGF